jgi:hypothetical protein
LTCRPLQRRNALETIRFTPRYHDDAIVTWLDGEMESEDARQFEQLCAMTATVRTHRRIDEKPSGL